MKYKVGEIYKLNKESLKWHSEYADGMHSVSGKVKVDSHNSLMAYGIDRFSYENGLDIYVLIEGDNGYNIPAFAYKCYVFNELGEDWGWFAGHSLEKL
jgi:hypothetical protein